MAHTVMCRTARLALSWMLIFGLVTGPAAAAVPKKPTGSLDKKELFLPDLSLSAANAPLAEVMDQLPNRAAWQAFAALRAAEGSTPRVFIDPRSGAATNIVRAVPLIPGRGVGNRITLQSFGEQLGRSVKDVDAAAVAEATLGYVRANSALLGIDAAQLGDVRATRITPDLWQVSIPQQYGGVPVRYGRVAASISHGNLITIGAQTWGNVTLPSVAPTLTPDAALAAGFAYAEGRSAEDEVLSKPALEIVPFASGQDPGGKGFAGPIGSGYGHRLVWTFVFRRGKELGQWEVVVDAHSGEVIAFQDRNEYAKRHVTGGVYPLTNTEICPDNQTCGIMQSAWPMPFADTGFPAPDDFSNSAGVFDFTSGAGATTLSGRYVQIQGPDGLSESSVAGAIGLGGTNGQHDLTSSGTSAGDTAAARTAFYEVNKIAEMARGYLPDNPWLQQPFITAVNEDDTCNAFYDPGTPACHIPPLCDNPGIPPSLHFFRSGDDGFGDRCRNTGEIAAVLDHEWGHGLDDNDAGGYHSGQAEAYADIAALYRTQASCLGPGFFQSNNDGCGANPDGTGSNVNMVADGTLHCATACSGVREADWAKHVGGTPDDVLGFTPHCFIDVGGEVFVDAHCLAAPVDQAAWDLVTRDLTAPPFNMNSQTAFIVGNKLFYQGSGLISEWYFVSYGNSSNPPTSNGCSGAYMGWLTADDDNGDLNDGTPHMTAIFNAFNRHGIACATPNPVNSGCAAGPAAAPSLNITPGHYQTALSWNSVPGATRYWVFRSEGHAGCNYGKALIAEVTGLSYVDTEVAAGRRYYYNVVAAGESSACYSKASNCANATPTAGSYTVSCAPSSLFVPGSGSDSTTCTVTSTGGYASAVSLGCTNLPSGASCSATPASMTLPAGGSVSSTVRVTTFLAPPGTHAFKVRGTPSAAPLSTHTAAVTLTVGGPGDRFATFDASRQAPSCGPTVGRSCDTGASLVLGRARLGPEPNQPNTISGACADGASGTLPQDGSNDRIRVATVDGTNFTGGKTVRITATVRARSTFQQDAADFFYAADAANPTWVFIGTSVPPGSGTQTLSTTYVLPKGAMQAVRVQFRQLSDNTPCSPGSLNDRDDLVFAVQ